MSEITTKTNPQNLAHRIEHEVSSDGPDSLITGDMIVLDEVSDSLKNAWLLWGEITDSLVVVVNVPTSGERFEIPVTGDPETRGKRAVNLLHHPFGRIAEVKNLSEAEIFAKHTILDQKAA